MKMHTLLLLALTTSSATAFPATAHTPLYHLPNGGFEWSLPNGVAVNAWTPYGTGYAIDYVEQHTGAQCLRCDSADATSIHGAVCNITLDQLVPTTIVLSGWSKAEEVGGAPDLDYSLYVDTQYVDGSFLYAKLAPFDIGTHDWQKRKLVFLLVFLVLLFVVFVIFRHQTDTVWFV